MSRDIGAGIALWRWPALLTGRIEGKPTIKRTGLGLLLRGRRRWIIVLEILAKEE